MAHDSLLKTLCHYKMLYRQFEGSISAPYDKVVVLMVDEAWNSAVRVEFGVRGSLVLLLPEVKRDHFVVEAHLFHDEDDFPNRSGFE